MASGERSGAVESEVVGVDVLDRATERPARRKRDTESPSEPRVGFADRRCGRVRPREVEPNARADVLGKEQSKSKA